MKILNIGYSRYKYPQDIKNLEEFVARINSKEFYFIQLQQFNEENCVHPFFTEEDIKTVYVNCMKVSEIFEEEITLLNRNDYEQRLEKCVQSKCFECVNYHEDSDDNMHGHRNKLCLDGTCTWYRKKDIS